MSLLKTRFNIKFEPPEWNPRYNIAPNQKTLTIIQKNGTRLLQSMTWGLTPKWSQDKDDSFTLINARKESVEEKPMYQQYLKNQRCIIPADGFYEWIRTNGKKVPMRIVPKNDLLFSFAALWDACNNSFSVTIITTPANSLILPFHNRMPAILTKETETIWLNETITDPKILNPVLKPFSSDEMSYYQASNVVNSWKHDNPECIQPI